MQAQGASIYLVVAGFPTISLGNKIGFVYRILGHDTCTVDTTVLSQKSYGTYLNGAEGQRARARLTPGTPALPADLVYKR